MMEKVGIRSTRFAQKGRRQINVPFDRCYSFAYLKGCRNIISTKIRRNSERVLGPPESRCNLVAKVNKFKILIKSQDDNG